MNTPTPRTDAATYPADCLGTTLVTNRDCPRALERELTEIHASFAGNVHAERDKLRAEVARLEKQIKDDNRSYGCELRDPYGTIWEQATADHARAERAEAKLAEAMKEGEK